MHPILFRLGPFTVYSYGAMVAFGFGVAVFFIYTRASKFNIDKNRMIDLCVFILIAGIIGARLLYVLLNLRYYAANPLEMIQLSKGGLIWYGGFISALAVFFIYIRKFRMDFWSVADLIAPYLALAQGVGRIGCFLNGCCYGRGPVQIYASLALFLIFIILRMWQDRRHFAGEIFLAYCVLYSFKRFFIEFLRTDNPKIIFGLTMSQMVSVAVFVAALLFFVFLRNKHKSARRLSGKEDI